jgi:hypothetical protein
LEINSGSCLLIGFKSLLAPSFKEDQVCLYKLWDMLFTVHYCVP